MVGAEGTAAARFSQNRQKTLLGQEPGTVEPHTPHGALHPTRAPTGAAFELAACEERRARSARVCTIARHKRAATPRRTPRGADRGIHGGWGGGGGSGENAQKGIVIV